MDAVSEKTIEKTPDAVLQPHVPLERKLCLSIKEASAYSGIGAKTVELMLKEPNCPFLLMVGNRRYVKRQLFEEFINSRETRELDAK